MRARAAAALEVLRGNPLCDPQRIAAIGYCFGGTVVLEIARSGADVAGVVSFHGGLDTPTPAEAKKHPVQGARSSRRRRSPCAPERRAGFRGGDARRRRGLAVARLRRCRA